MTRRIICQFYVAKFSPNLRDQAVVGGLHQQQNVSPQQRTKKELVGKIIND
jgi:hypothetical protein